jgi:UDP-N-acetylglucosamine--N-acetylmuramyl-(pentapeptide) pyrophosphoryl-undecaprenol N-acetylglucosamine transferase
MIMRVVMHRALSRLFFRTAATWGRHVRSLKLCLAASGGGHVRQLLDLQPVWAREDAFFITEPTALGHSISADHSTHFVAHVAWGQTRLGAPLRMIAGGIKNAWSSLRIIWRERPDVVITTGAGSMAFAALWARLFGARIILIDSFARFDAPSLFARLVGPIAHKRIAQSPASASKWPGSILFDPFRFLDSPRPPKRDLLFATVGATLPFDRLVEMVASAASAGLTPSELVMQVGEGGVQPTGIDCHETLPFGEVQALLQSANIVICHGGTGSIITALKAGCHVIVVPREFARGEHYDDHQLEIAETFADRGCIQVARDDDGLRRALAGIPDRTPVMATTDPAALIDWLTAELDRIRNSGR